MKWMYRVLAVLLAAALLSWQPAIAQEEDDGDSGQEEFACRALLTFAISASVYALSGSVVAAGLAGYQAADLTFASSLTLQTCTKAMKEYAESYMENPVDYEDFLRTHCNGNPMTCPGNLSATGFSNWGNPRECDTYIICSYAILGQTKPDGFSIPDLVNAMHFVNYSAGLGYWAVDQYGGLVGLHSTVTQAGNGDFDVR